MVGEIKSKFAADGSSTHLQEFLFGTGKRVATTPGTGNVVLTWLQRTGVSGYSLLESTTLGAWSQSAVAPVTAPDQTNVPASYTRIQATVPTTHPQSFLRVMGEEF